MKFRRMWVVFRRSFYSPETEWPIAAFDEQSDAERGRYDFSSFREMIVAVDDDGSVSIVAPWEPFTTVAQEEK